MRAYIEKLKRKEDLTIPEIESVMEKIMSGDAPEQMVADWLLSLNLKGPTIDEITGAARLLQKFYLPVKTGHPLVLDTCGTGGDKKHTFNISTITAFVVAGAGVVVAKHGNRSVSSKCGSADLLEALGVNLDIDYRLLGPCLDQTGIVFLFAQKLHPAMKNVAPVRKALGVETIFNILGPLINPARATHQLMGVYSRDLVNPLAYVLKNLGLKRGMVVHGSDGLDEVTTTGPTFVSEWDGRAVLSYEIDPREFDIPLTEPETLKGGDLKKNLYIAKEVLDGVQGPRRDIVVLNAAYALYVADRVQDVREGVGLAQEAIDSGKAKAKLEALITFTQKPKTL
ncbi:MAG TPA: anthranilate phosphoribosyltransferase [Candidatus Omnitrophota bacterium]|nr:anthranilate phosphoribosyltransferase [Candidatus Omnitrophota bacterium]HPB68504.1 anthranilate phosphoribosyltransferase [Candidatus Omnitrophota bacterium]HQO57296.1 anthranilate phosphoribosyltransferase [Candidatus Omnitrophota bacterium]